MIGIDGTELHDDVSGPPLDPSCASDDAHGVEVQIGRVEEEHLANLRLERVEPERNDRGAMVGGGNRELQLDAVRLPRERKHLRELFVREPPGDLPGHRLTVAMPDYAVEVLLYNSAVSGNCYKVRLLLTQLGIEFKTVELSVVDRSNRTEVLGELNPGLRVPTIVLDDGRPLGESNAILWYFGDGTQYVPDDPYERAQVLQWQFFEQYSHEPNIAVARFWIAYSGHAGAVRGGASGADEGRVRGARRDGAASRVENVLRRRALLAGRHLSLRLYARRTRGWL